MLPVAPGRFSTTNCWASLSASAAATARVRRSVLMPAANGQITVTGRVGQGNGDDVGSARDATDDARTYAATTAAAKDLLNLLSIASQRRAPWASRYWPLLRGAARPRNGAHASANAKQAR